MNNLLSLPAHERTELADPKRNIGAACIVCSGSGICTHCDGKEQFDHDCNCDNCIITEVACDACDAYGAGGLCSDCNGKGVY